MHDILFFLGVFAACLVEAVEALTIVLAIGYTRGWRSAWEGVAAAVGVLVVAVAVLGKALTAIPIGTLRLVVGGLLLIFGLQWLRKAILRASGFKAVHDEAAVFTRQTAAARSAVSASNANRDWYGFTVAFKGVLLEGLEVVFIVVTVGASQGSLALAVAAALCAVVIVVVAGVAVRHPLERVPENTLKFAVGVLLTSFGTFWAAEGAGLEWPSGDLAIGSLIVFYGLSAWALTVVLRREQEARSGLSAGAT